MYNYYSRVLLYTAIFLRTELSHDFTELSCLVHRNLAHKIFNVHYINPYPDLPKVFSTKCLCKAYILYRFKSIINPRRTWAARVTVVVSCVCVCMYVCVCVHSYLPHHTLESQNRDTKVHSNTAIVFNFADFPKNALFESYGIICLPRAVPAS